MKRAFDLFDRDGDGQISYSEMQDVLKTLGKGASEAEMRTLVGGDVSGVFTARNGTIDFELFKKLLYGDAKADLSSSSLDLGEAFRLLDGKENRGYIDCEDLRKVCKRLGEDLTRDEVNDMVHEALIGFDGKIYYDGLLKILITQ